MSLGKQMLRMTLIGVLICVSSLPLFASDRTQRDLLERRMAESVIAEDYGAFLDQLAQFRRAGGIPVPDILYYEALALDRTGDPVAANDAIKAFLDTAGQSHRLYGGALSLAADLDGKAGNALARRADLARMSATPSGDLGALYTFVQTNWTTPEAADAARRIREIEEPLVNRNPDIRRRLPGKSLKAGFGQPSISLSPDGTRVALIDYGSNVHISFIDSGQVQWAWTQWNGGATRGRIAFSPASELFAIANSNGAVTLFDLRVGRASATISSRNGVQSMSFSKDGTRLAMALSNGTVLVHDIAAKQDLWRFAWKGADGLHARSVALSPDSRTLVIAGSRQAVVWDVESRTFRYELKAQGAFNNVAFAADGATFAIADNVITHIYDAKSGSIVRNVVGHAADPVRTGRQWPVGSGVQQIGFAESGRFFTAGGGAPPGFTDELPRPGSVYVYEPDGTLLAILSGHGEDGECHTYQKETCRMVDGAAITPDGRTVVTAGKDGFLRVWRIP